MNGKLFCGLLAAMIAMGAHAFAQGGPPPFAKEKGNPAEDSGKPPFLSDKEVMERFQKEFGVPAGVYEKVAAHFTNDAAFRGEKTIEKKDESGAEKVRSNTIMVLIIAASQVNAAEQKGEMKKEGREENLLSRAKEIMTKHTESDGGWGPLAHDAGLKDAGELFMVKRSVDWGQPIDPELKKKLGIRD